MLDDTQAVDLPAMRLELERLASRAVDAHRAYDAAMEATEKVRQAYVTAAIDAEIMRRKVKAAETHRA